MESDFHWGKKGVFGGISGRIFPRNSCLRREPKVKTNKGGTTTDLGRLGMSFGLIPSQEDTAPGFSGRMKQQVGLGELFLSPAAQREPGERGLNRPGHQDTWKGAPTERTRGKGLGTAKLEEKIQAEGWRSQESSGGAAWSCSCAPLRAGSTSSHPKKPHKPQKSLPASQKKSSQPP